MAQTRQGRSAAPEDRRQGSQGRFRKLLTKRYKNQLARLDQTRAEDIFQAYINTFAMSYDPHTNYLSPDNAENFDINMSLSLEGIGAVLQSDNDQVKIVRLVPAGPADKTKQVAPADKIIGVAQGNKEMVDVVGWRLDEVVKLIRGPKGTVVRLEVIPANNAPNDQTSKIVPITREAVKLEDQAVKKSVLNLKQDGKDYKLGVIEIPAFYLDFKAFRAGDPDYKSTTRDVKKTADRVAEGQGRRRGHRPAQQRRRLPAGSHRADQPVHRQRSDRAGAQRRRPRRRPGRRKPGAPSTKARWRCWSTACPPRPRRFSPAPCRTTTAR